MRSQVHDQIFSNAERFAAYFTYVRLLPRMYTHMDLEISLARDQFAANLASDEILTGVYLEVHLQSRLPIALEIAHVTFVFLSLAVRLHVSVQISSTRVRSVADLADERFLPRVGEQVSLQRLIRIEAFTAYLAMSHVLLVVLLLVQSQIVAGYLGYTADVAGESLVVLLQMSLQEFFRFEAFVAKDTLKRFLFLMYFDHVLLQLLLIREGFVAFLATINNLVVPLVILPVLQELKPLPHPLVAHIAFVDHCTPSSRFKALNVSLLFLLENKLHLCVVRFLQRVGGHYFLMADLFEFFNCDAFTAYFVLIFDQFHVFQAFYLFYFRFHEFELLAPVMDKNR